MQILRRLVPHPVLTLLLTLSWLFLAASWTLNSLLFGLGLGLIIPFVTRPYWPNRPPLRKPLMIAEYMLVVLWDIVIANVIVAPEYGAIGVAWVTAITISLRMMVHIVLARHYTGALSLPDPRVLSPGNLKRLMKRT